MKTKICTKCGKEKPISEFGKNKSRCKECTNKYNKEWRKNNKESIAKYNKEYKKEYQIKHKEKIAKRNKKIELRKKIKSVVINKKKLDITPTLIIK